MWCRKSLVKIQVHQVHTEVSRAHLAYKGIHVCAIHVEQPALGVKNIGNLVNLLLEDPERVRVGEHQSRNIFIHLRGECAHVYHAALVRFQVFYGIPYRRGCGRISPMCGVRDQNLLARITFRLQISPHQQKSRELPVRASRRLQGDRIHAGDLHQALAQGLQDSQCALRNLFGLIRMALVLTDMRGHARLAWVPRLPRWRSTANRCGLLMPAATISMALF